MSLNNCNFTKHLQNNKIILDETQKKTKKKIIFRIYIDLYNKIDDNVKIKNAFWIGIKTIFFFKL